jgi:hypothetical protein
MRTRTETVGVGYAPAAVGSPSPQRIRWGAVFGGAVLGIALLALLTALWIALAYGSEIVEIRDNLEWYLGGSAVVSLFVAGLLAGWLSGVHGAGSGFFNGVTIWAMMLLVTIVAFPAIRDLLNLGGIAQIDETSDLLVPAADTVLWATFLSIVGGLVASGIGGAIGGALARPANAHLFDEAARRVERPARPDLDEERTVVIPEAEDEKERVTYHQRVP